MGKMNLFILLLVLAVGVQDSTEYSAREDARIIAKYRRVRAANHAKVARTLVHQANWTALGTISTNSQVPGFPMVNIISVDDSDTQGKSTGKIHFLLTDLDFSGNDWKKLNKVTVLFSQEQILSCRDRGVDPMEPTCARTIISGQIKELEKDSKEFNDILASFVKRHPASTNWMREHSFYLCELQIENIFVLDFYGGPHSVTSEDYYANDPDVNNMA